MSTILIDSRYRNNGGFDSFTWTASFPYTPGNEIELQNVTMMNSAYVFQSGVNNVIPFIEAATPGINRTATITPGSYSITDLCAEIKTQMDAAGTQVYTVTFDIKTSTITISAPAAFTLKWSLQTNTNCAWELGWSQSDTPSAVSHTSTQSYNISGPNYYLIQIRGLQMDSINTSNQQPATGSFMVTVDAAPGNIINFNSQESFRQKWRLAIGSNISSLKVTVLRPDGRPAGLRSDWSLVLRCD